VILDADARLDGVRAECAELWQEAISAQEVQSLLSGGVHRQERARDPPIHRNGSEIGDPKRLRELSDRSVDLAKTLAALLDRVIALRIWGTPSPTSS
jgi:hypothetical protein